MYRWTFKKVLTSAYVAMRPTNVWIDYTKDADPRLTGADRTWATRLLRAAGLR